MIIEIDTTDLEAASLEQLKEWKDGLVTIIGRMCLRGDLGAIRAVEIVERVLDKEILQRRRKG